MANRTLILASASPVRLRLLRDAGFDPKVVVTGVAEDDLDGPTREVVRLLARRKAESALGTDGAIVIACDTLLDLDGAALGKMDPEAARASWRARRNRSGILLTGHCVIDRANGASAEGVAETRVAFGNPTDAEIDAYVATGEPSRVAGGFTIDGYAAPFVDRLEGDAGNVLGLSLPLLRTLLGELDIGITDLWA